MNQFLGVSDILFLAVVHLISEILLVCDILQQIHTGKYKCMSKIQGLFKDF